MRSRFTEKIAAARRLCELIRYTSNWKQIWQALNLGQPVPEFRLRGGLRIAGSSVDDVYGIFQEIFCERCYTHKLYKPATGDVVVDIGGNVGIFALFLAWLRRDIFVHTFEPLPSTRDRLIHNVKKNALDAIIEVHPLAVAGTSGTLNLHTGDSAGHTSLVESEFTTQATTIVEAVNLQEALDLCTDGPIALLKVDCEGAELDIFQHAAPAVLSRVQRVVVEYHDLLRPGCRDIVQRHLTAAGFRVTDHPVSSSNHDLGLLQAWRA